MPAKQIFAYVIMRNDLDSLNPGKACAHAHHAGTRMVAWINKHGTPAHKRLLKQWANEAEGVGTTIVLEASHEQMRVAIAQAQAARHAAGVWNDPTFPSTTKKGFFLMPMDVCGWILGEKDKLAGILGDFPLMR